MINFAGILMKHELREKLIIHHHQHYHRMYEGISRRTQLFGEIMERMYSSQKIDSTFSALGKSIGDDYNVRRSVFL